MEGKDLVVSKVSKQFSGVPVLSEVDVEARGGQVLGLVGVNGAGKTTLMNILAGEVSLDMGEISIGGRKARISSPSDSERLGIALIHQEPVDFSHMSVAENIFISRLQRFKGLPVIRRRQMELDAAKLLEQLGSNLNPRSRVSELSMGGRQQVAVARALAQQASIILFDEPTASLPIKEKQHLFELIGILRKRGVVIIYITHFLDEVKQICDSVCILRDGRVASMGPTVHYSLNDIIREMIGRDLEKVENLGVSQERRGTVLLDVRSLSAGARLKSVSFSLHAGEVIGLWGLMGSGRTELVRAILGLDPISSGNISFLQDGKMRAISGKQLLQRCGYITENRHDDGLFLPEAVWWNVSSASMKGFVRGPFLRMDTNREKRAAIKIAEDLQIRMPSVTLPVRKLSGGNQQKVVVAKWLQRHPTIYFMDEPTRGVDVGSKAEIQRIIRALASQGAGVVLVSSEVEEIMGLSDRVLVLRAGTLVGEISYPSMTKEQLMALSIGNSNEL